jgi:N-succinyldiaminopimelate aminotransferase
MPRFPRTAASAQSLSDRVFGQAKKRSAPASTRPSRVYPLHVGDTYLDPLPQARAQAQRSADHPRLHNYSPVQGEPALLSAIRDKVQRKSGVTLDLENIQVQSGATAALGVVCTALLEPGDEVIIPAPFWPLIRGLVRARGATAVEVPLFTRLDDPSFDAVSAIEAAITERTVAIYVNTPQNPTSAVLPERVIAGIAQLAQRHDLWVFSDEVYEDVWFAEAPFPSVFARPDLRERTVASHSLSKAYGFAGGRVGYTHGPAAAMSVIRSVQTFYSYCAPRPMQFGAAAALNEGDAWLADMRALYKRAGQAAARALEIPPPQGGTFLFFDLKPHMRRGETTQDVLERCADAGVMLTPGLSCGSDFDTWARLCFTCVPEEDLFDALARLRKELIG